MKAVRVEYIHRQGHWFAKVELGLHKEDIDALAPEIWLKNLFILTRTQSSGIPTGKFLFEGQLVSPRSLEYDPATRTHRFCKTYDISMLIPTEPTYICVRCYRYQTPITLLDPQHEK